MRRNRADSLIEEGRRVRGGISVIDLWRENLFTEGDNVRECLVAEARETTGERERVNATLRVSRDELEEVRRGLEGRKEEEGIFFD